MHLDEDLWVQCFYSIPEYNTHIDIALNTEAAIQENIKTTGLSSYKV